MVGFCLIYSLISAFQPRAVSSLTTPRTTAAPRLRSPREKPCIREWLRISEYSISGIIAEPVVAIASISLRSLDRSLVHDAVMAASLPAMRSCFTLANRSGSGTDSPPDSEAKTEEISPSFFATCSRVVAVARPLVVLIIVLGRAARRIVDNIMEDSMREGDSRQRTCTIRKFDQGEAYLLITFAMLRLTLVV